MVISYDAMQSSLGGATILSHPPFVKMEKFNFVETTNIQRIFSFPRKADAIEVDWLQGVSGALYPEWVLTDSMIDKLIELSGKHKHMFRSDDATISGVISTAGVKRLAILYDRSRELSVDRDQKDTALSGNFFGAVSNHFKTYSDMKRDYGAFPEPGGSTGSVIIWLIVLIVIILLVIMAWKYYKKH